MLVTSAFLNIFALNDYNSDTSEYAQDCNKIRCSLNLDKCHEVSL